MATEGGQANVKYVLSFLPADGVCETQISAETRGENVTNQLVMAAINGDESVERATPRTFWVGLRLR